MAKYFRQGKIGFPAKAEVDFGRPEFQNVDPLEKYYLKKLLNDKKLKFRKWFFHSALRGNIIGDKGNYERTTWFKRTSKKKGYGVALSPSSRVEVRDLEPYLGAAVWTSNRTKKYMSFRRANQDGKILTGELIPERRKHYYLRLKWVDQEKRRKWPNRPDLQQVPGKLKIGSKY